jgi:hypothetical protein
MPATRTQLVGGLFQDANGTVLNAGYLIFELSQDSQVTGLNTEVCAGVKIRVPLNTSGSIVNTAGEKYYIWGNDDLLPINSFYIVTGYTASGQLAWGPNHQQVTSGTTFDVGTWVPDFLTNWQPPLQSPQLETNGVTNGNQGKLNLKNGTNVTIVDAGNGDVTINGPSSVAFKHNTVANSSQLILDLTNGSNILITDGGAGVISIALAAQPYDIGIPIVGKPDASERIGYVMPRAVTFPANFSTSYASAITASAGTIVFTMYKNTSTAVGTITFTASATGVFASTSGLAQSFSAGDLLELVAPASVDASWANGRFTIVGSR